MTQDDLIKVFLSLTVVLALTLLQRLINTRRTRRGRQVFLPLAAIVVSVCAIPVFYRYYDLLHIFCAASLRFNNAEILILNAGLMLCFCIVKLILCPIVSSLWKKKALMEKTSSRFYALDERYGEWFLKSERVNFRKLVHVLSLAMACVTFLALSITWIKGDSAWWIVWYPASALTVMTECFSFINGITLEEFSHETGGFEADSRRIKGYYKIREIYEKLFPGQMLASHTGCEFFARTGSTSLINSLKKSEDAVDNYAAQYFLTYCDRPSFDNDCIKAAVSLLHGRNVVFFNPFYRDLGAYLTLPLVNVLLSGKHCLVISGRSSINKDAAIWLEELLKNYSHVRALWRVRELGKDRPECDVGLLSFRQLYDMDVLTKNRAFFNDVGFVLLLEPSVVVNTGQIGIRVICEEISRFGDDPVYCICDRYTDGLVDTMSHLLKAEITDVAAPPVPRSVYTGMGWNADGDYLRQELFDKQTGYLGNGVELASVAVRNQVSKVTWYSEKKAPLRDIRWIAGQYYSTICRYMNTPIHQSSLYEKIAFEPSLWSNAAAQDQFIIVEDEFCNLFSTMRAFLSRGKDHTFINVLSENYLLRDYMRCNQQIFLSNPNAIPSLVPDYAKTERNAILKLLMKMAVAPVSENEIRSELLLIGCRTDDVLETLTALLKKYTSVTNAIFSIKSVLEEETLISAHKINYYSISGDLFNRYFSRSLKNAYYIVEEEKREAEYIDAKMFGHVSQTVLPGQFVTYDGKYYEIRTVSPEIGVILRRASDHYSGRHYYRQLRTYHFEEQDWSELVYSRTLMDIEISVVNCDFSVTTSGYLDMGTMHDLRMAKIVSYDGDPHKDNYSRSYRRKSVLRIRFPDTDDKIRFTLCLLLSEIFRSVFPDAWQYLAVTALRPGDIEGMLNCVVYTVEGCVEDDYIYVIEDSEIDLGLLDAVSRNLPRLLEIMADFLDWHFEKMREPESADPIPNKIKLPEEEKRKSLFRRMADYIRRLFSKKEPEVKLEEPEDIEEEALREPVEAETGEDIPAGAYELDAGEERKAEPPVWPKAEEDPEAGDFSLEEEEKTEASGPHRSERELRPAEEPTEERDPEDEIEAEEEDADLVHIDGTDIFDEEGSPETELWLQDSFMAAGITPIGRTRYQMECYLKFGFDEVDARLRIEDVQKYLRVRGCCNNDLTLARKRTGIADTPDQGTENQCDFCGRPLNGVSYEMLNDGRIRCNDCSATAITTVEEFSFVFSRALELLEMFYEINFHVPISVKMADARFIAKGAGYVFRPGKQMDSRVLGYAQRKKGRYSIFMENGSPRLATIDTMVHELTHIWQYLNWNDREVIRIYGMNSPDCTAKARSIVYEGMAVWAAIQYLYLIGETYYASLQEEITKRRGDAYGIGFRLYCEQYPLIKDSSLLKYSPFKDFPMIEPEKVRQAVRAQCTKKRCVC